MPMDTAFGKIPEMNTAPANRPPDQATPNTLKFDITNVLSQAHRLKTEAGRSEKGRQLAIVVTDLEKLQAYIGYYGL